MVHSLSINNSKDINNSGIKNYISTSLSHYNDKDLSIKYVRFN